MLQVIATQKTFHRTANALHGSNASLVIIVRPEFHFSIQFVQRQTQAKGICIAYSTGSPEFFPYQASPTAVFDGWVECHKTCTAGIRIWRLSKTINGYSFPSSRAVTAICR
jgi:hypothetical protein